MSEESKLPVIRFEEFKGEWGEKSIQDLIDEQAIIGHLDGNHGELYPRSHEFSGSGIPYISANDFTDGVVDFSRCKHLPVLRARKFKKGIAKDGDILFAHNATVGPVAKLKIDFEFVIISTTATYFRCDNNVLINDYLLQALLDAKFVKQYSRVMAQSTRNQVPITVQRKFFISIPPEPKEQTKIGNYFQQLDTLITQLQKKKNKLLTIKKSLLEKLFPKQGQAEPEIRFKGFVGDWETIELKSIFNNIRNAYVGTATPYYADSGNFYLESNNVKNGKINRNKEIFINDEFYKKQSDKWLRTGDIVMVQSGHVGHTAVIPPELDNIAAHALIMFANPKGKVNSYFLNFQFLTTEAKSKLSKITTGNTIKHILSSDMKEFEVINPKYSEQNKIAALFKKLDTLITHHQTQLKKLNNIKQACLAKMFV